MPRIFIIYTIYTHTQRIICFWNKIKKTFKQNKEYNRNAQKNIPYHDGTHSRKKMLLIH